MIPQSRRRFWLQSATGGLFRSVSRRLAIQPRRGGKDSLPVTRLWMTVATVAESPMKAIMLAAPCRLFFDMLIAPPCGIW